MVRTGLYFAAAPALLAGLAVWRGGWGWAVVLAALAGFILYFFRDPERTIPAEPGLIVSPADGKVIKIDRVEQDGRNLARVSIFLTLFDVHVNRAPIAGRIAGVAYRRGKFHVASHDAASGENEQNEVVVEGENTRVVFRQIAGLLARRIEFWKRPGEAVERGERVGMIRFGSRVEIFFDPHYQVQVRPGQQVHGGASVLARRQ